MHNDASALTDGAKDIVHIADGDSTANGWDKIYKFGIANDELDLATPTVAGNAGMAFGATSVGNIAQHSIASGVVKFFDKSGAAVNINNEAVLKDALAYLAANLNGTGSTVAF